jgi:hypothetical protein
MWLLSYFDENTITDAWYHGAVAPTIIHASHVKNISRKNTDRTVISQAALLAVKEATPDYRYRSSTKTQPTGGSIDKNGLAAIAKGREGFSHERFCYGQRAIQS